VLNLGTPELLVILVIALLVLGPNNLPEAARQVGRIMGELRKVGAGFQAEMRDAMREPVTLTPAEPTVATEPIEPPAADEASPEPGRTETTD
jgi:sec-independent protein translocase protein TatA